MHRGDAPDRTRVNTCVQTQPHGQQAHRGTRAYPGVHTCTHSVAAVSALGRH